MKYAVVLAMLIASSAQALPASVTLAEALRAGSAAEADGDAKGMMQAAMRLHRLGAHPVEGEPDLARIWADKAQALGVAPAATRPWRGRVLGPAYRSGVLPAGAQFTTRQSFVAGQRADVTVQPVEGAQLALAVSEGDSKMVCAVSASREALGCRWVPTVTDINVITVTNPGPHAGRFYLILN
jgi:hypothetical protein